MGLRVVSAQREPSLRKIAAVYLADLQTRAGSEHYRTTKRQLLRIVTAVKTASNFAVLNYRARRLAERPRPSNRAVNMEVGALRACLNWAADEAQIIEASTLGKIKGLPYRAGDKKRRPHALSDDERRRFLLASRQMDLWRDVAQTPLWMLLLSTGIRWGDALALTPANVVGDVLFIAAEETKGSEDRTIPLPPGLADIMQLPFRTPKGMLWTHRNEKNARRMMRAALRRAKIPLVDGSGRRVYLHAFRATAAATMFRRGARLPTVSRMLGHKDPAFTAKHYLPPDLDSLQEEMGKVWGHG